MKKALIVSPYLDHLGGGERYMLYLSSVVESLGYELFFAWDNVDDIQKLSTQLGIKLNRVQLDAKIKKLYFEGSALSMFSSTRVYDLVVYLSDGSIPLLGGKRNLLHIQVPFHDVAGRSIGNQIKQRFIYATVVNSEFTKSIIDKEYGISSYVAYPPVQLLKQGKNKDKIILSVGRFDPSLNVKHQDILIESYKQLSKEIPGWKLVLAGGSSDDAWMAKLKSLAVGYAIEFYENISHSELANLYETATIYWHAAGYQVDELKYPELTEHFGISTVEAISAGCIPLVVPFGGQKEILKDSSFHWQTMEELQDKTMELINNPVYPEIDLEGYSEKNFAGTITKLLT